MNNQCVNSLLSQHLKLRNWIQVWSSFRSQPSSWWWWKSPGWGPSQSPSCPDHQPTWCTTWWMPSSWTETSSCRTYQNWVLNLKKLKNPKICAKALTTYAPSAGAFATPTSNLSCTSRNQKAMQANRWTFGASKSFQGTHLLLHSSPMCSAQTVLSALMPRGVSM